MARLPARVDWIEHKRTGTKVALRLDKRKMVFQAEYGGETFSSKDGAEVRAKVLAAIEESHQLTFEPVIEVEVARKNFGSAYSQSPGFSQGMALAITRYYISREGRLRQQTWDDHERNNVMRLRVWRPSGYSGRPEDFTLPFSQPHQRRYGSDYYYLPYTEETWEGLQRIIALIESAKENLAAFLADPGVVAKLVLIGTGSPYPLIEGGGEQDVSLDAPGL